MSRTVWILSLTPVTDEPRVRRQAAACIAKGWNVVVAGYPGRATKPDGWTLVEIRSEEFPRKALPGFLEKLKTLLGPQPNILSRGINFSVRCCRRLYKSFLIGLMPFARLHNRAARALYWRTSCYMNCLQFLKDKIAAMPDKTPDLIIANDYFTAPMAYAICEDLGCSYSVDIHEYATGQYMHSFLWRLFMRPWVDRIQRLYLPCAAFNTTVCDGIADLLAKDYAPMPRPAVVRSTPSFIEMSFRQTGEQIDVLYHGIIYHTRGLKLAVESVPLWRPEFNLIIRGPGSEDYLEELRQYARKLGVENRVRLEQPVLFHDIIPAANKCDIGYFVHEDISPQKRFTLPNKYFEYVMAGMALCTSDLPEMARITKQYDLGRLVSDFTPQSVAEVINSFTREDIDRYKQNSLKAAKDLCWEREASQMTDAFEKLMGTEKKAAA